MYARDLPPAVAEAFTLFARKTSLREHDRPLSTVEQTGAMREFAHRAGKLRLHWSEDSCTLTLEISDGPPTGAAVGWLDLFCATVHGPVLQPDQHDFTLDEALDYGLEMMFPEPVGARENSRP